MNQKIDRVTKEIDKTKDKIFKLQIKLRVQEQRKITLENDEIIALYRKEKLTEDDLMTLVKSKREYEQDVGDGTRYAFFESQGFNTDNNATALSGEEESKDEN